MQKLTAFVRELQPKQDELFWSVAALKDAPEWRYNYITPELPGLFLGIIEYTMLSKKHRFHGHGSLRYLYKNGTAVRSHWMTVKYIPNPRRKHSRISVVISKKVHKSAVGRNRIRRRVYEIVRHELPKFQQTHDLAIIVISGETLKASHEELAKSLMEALVQTSIYNK